MPKKIEPKKIERLWDAIEQCNPNEIDKVLSSNAYILFLTGNLRKAETDVDRADSLLLIVLYLRRGLVIAAEHLTKVLERIPEGCAPPVSGYETRSGQRALEDAIKFLQKVEVSTEKYSGSDQPTLDLIKLFNDCVNAELLDRAKIKKYVIRAETTYYNLGIFFRRAIGKFDERAQRRIAFLCATQIDDRQKLSSEQQIRLSEFKLASKNALLKNFYPIILSAQRAPDLESACELAVVCMGDLQKKFSAVTRAYMAELNGRAKLDALQNYRLLMHLYFNAFLNKYPYPPGSPAVFAVPDNPL